MSAHLTDTAFSSLPLHPLLQKGLQQAGFEFCTPIQAQSLPLLLANHDVAGQAQTGTGKTIAFLLATFQRLLTNQDAQKPASKQPRALILAPTRELAIQIVKDAELLNSHAGLRIVIAHGGKDYQRQRDAIDDGCDVLIGTPGRLLDFHKQRVFNLNNIEAVVLDEADRMFDLGFIKDVRFFLRRLPSPEKRLGMLFSATLSYKVTEEWVYYPSNEEKIPLLLALIKRIQPIRSIVFVNTKQVAERVWGFLEGNGYKAALLSGDVPQKKRESLLKHFQDGEFPYLVATDVAARGLHIPEVSHVFNFDLPQDAEDYVHRTGRTARAGASGIAISLACEEYAFSLPDIEQYIKHKLPVAQSTDEQLETPQPRIKAERNPAPRHKNKTRGDNSHNNRPRSGKRNNGPKKPVTSDANQ
jgi:ATP-dependent RNA helicase RhlB